MQTLLPGSPPQLLVHEESEKCPYLPNEQALLPLRLPLRPLTPKETDSSLARGDRRHGRLLYRTECPQCQACEPIRLDVSSFQLSRGQKRTLRVGNRRLRTEIGSPRFSDGRLALYERHKDERGLRSPASRRLTGKAYQHFLVDTCVDSFELRFFAGADLVGIAVSDRGENALSLVYCYFDPSFTDASIGTYSILRHAELCQQWHIRYLYLGLYIRDNPHMRYKAMIGPHERLVQGEWRAFDRVTESPEDPG